MKNIKLSKPKIEFFKLLKLAEDQKCFEIEQEGDKVILKFWPSFLDDIPEDIIIFSIIFRVEEDQAVLEEIALVTEHGEYRLDLDICCNVIQAWLDTINLCY